MVGPMLDGHKLSKGGGISKEVKWRGYQQLWNKLKVIEVESNTEGSNN